MREGQEPSNDVATVANLSEMTAFDPEMTRMLGTAFDEAWRILQETKKIPPEHHEAIRAQVGDRIFDLARRGESDPEKLAAYGLAMTRL
jgi:hypothetical protein